MSLILTTEDRDVLISVFFTGPDGGIATFADPPEWHSADTNIVTVVAADDCQTATVSAVGLGSGALLVTAKVDSGTFSGQLEVTVIDPAADPPDDEESWDTVELQAVFVLRETHFTRKLHLIETDAVV